MSNSTSCYVKMIREICREENISLESFGGDWVFRLERGDKEGYILGYQFGLNLAVAQQICADKSAASEVMKAHGIPHVPHHCFMTPEKLKYIDKEGNWEEMLSVFRMYGDVVVKDNQGTGGELVYRVRSVDRLEQAAQEIFRTCQSLAISPYVEIEKEYRVILLDGEIQLVFHKLRDFVTGDGRSTLRQLYAGHLMGGGAQASIPAEKLEKILPDGQRHYLNWKHNLGQGARAVVEEDPAVTGPAVALALRAARLFGLRFASVDVIRCSEGLQVLEINPGVMMENLASSSQELYRKAKEIYRRAVLKMLS